MYRRAFLAFVIFLSLVGLIGGQPACAAQKRDILSIVDFSPSGELSSDMAIRAVFSKAMAERADVGRRLADDELPIAIDPPLRGSGKWEDELTFIYYISPSSLRKGTNYRATFAAGLSAIDGTKLAEETVRSFCTEAIALAGVRQTNYYKDRGEVEYEMLFNQAVHPEDLASSLSVLDADRRKPIAARVMLGPATVRPRVRVAFGEGDAVFLVKPGLLPAGGNAAATTEMFARAPRNGGLRIGSVWARSDASECVINIDVSMPVSAQEAGSCITIEPSKGRTSVETTYGTIQVRGSFAPRDRVTVKIKRGMRSLEGETLAEDWTGTLVMPDIRPSIDFMSSGRFISPQAGSMDLGIKTVNVDAIEVRAERIYDSNVPFLLRGGWPNGTASLGEHVSHIKMKVPNSAPNEIVSSALDLGEIVGGRRGVFEISLGHSGGWASDTRVLNVTDLGTSAKIWETGALVWVNSITSARPVEGASVSLWSYSSQNIASGTTGRDGVCLIERNARWDPALRPDLVIVEKGDDVAILRLDRSIWNKGSEELGGAEYPSGPYVGICALPRDIFRTGESVPVSFVVRRSDLSADAEFPIEVVLRSPLGRVWERKSVMLSDLGCASTRFDLNETCFTGVWRLAAYMPGTDEPICEGSFTVGDFAPPRVEVSLDLGGDVLIGTSEADARLSARYLFGTAASDARYELTAHIKPLRWAHKGLEGYVFSDERSQIGSKEMTLASGVLDAQGGAECRVALDLAEPGTYTAGIKAGVEEDGGRWAYKTASLSVSSYAVLCGVRVPDGNLRSGSEAEIGFAAVHFLDGSPASPRAAWTLYRKRSTMALRTDGERTYAHMTDLLEPIEGMEERPLAFDDKGMASASVKLDGGAYLMEIEDLDTGMKASASLYVYDPNGAADAADLGDRLEIALDRPIYSSGERITGYVSGCSDGATVLVALETDRVLDRVVKTAASGRIEFSFRAADEMRPNAWITAQCISAASDDAAAPRRAFGAARAEVDTSPIKLDVEITSPDQLKPGMRNTFVVTARDRSGRAASFETILMAVDDGVLGLSGYKTPSMSSVIDAKRGLAIDIYDIYADLISVVRGLDLLTPGGGDEDAMNAEKAALRSSLSPVRSQRFKILTASETARSDMFGRAEVSLDIPEDASGRVRVVAIAVARKAFGAADRAYTIERPIEASMSLPRFMAPCDKMDSTLTIYSSMDEEMEMTVAIHAQGPMAFNGGKRELSESVVIPAHGKAVLPLTAEAGEESGVARVSLSISAGEIRMKQDIEMPVRSPLPRAGESRSDTVLPGETKNIVIPGEYFAGTRSAYVIMSGRPELGVADIASWLIRYPYGCTEQTVSGGWAELVMPSLIDAAFGSDGNAPTYVSSLSTRIDDIRSRQNYDGGFSIWPGGGSSEWTSLYAAHFLKECERRGRPVPRECLDALGSYVRGILDISENDSDAAEVARVLELKAYAAYITARYSSAPRGSIDYLCDRADEIPYGGRMMLCAALAASGERDRARSMLGGAGHGNVISGRASIENNYASPMRERALELIARNEIGLDDADEASVARSLIESMSGASFSTQEGGFALIASDGYLSRYTGGGRPSLTALDESNGVILGCEGGAEVCAPISQDITLISVKNEGEGPGYVTVITSGMPTSTPTPRDSGVRATASYRRISSKGEALEGEITTGDLVELEVGIIPLVPRIEDLAVCIPLPSSLEIEGTDIDDYSIARIEKRDDRVIIFIDNIDKEYIYRLRLRAVSAGDAALPAISAEGMYTPDISSVGEAGRIQVISARSDR